jgi:hypothetical protein
MERLAGTAVLVMLLSWLWLAPAEAKPKPPTPSCTFANGMTTCTERTTTTSPGPQDGQACVTSDNQPGTIEQEQTNTTTTTRTYKGRKTSGTPVSQSSQTASTPGPATCVADPTTVPTGTLAITPTATCDPDYSCYTITGAALQPGSRVLVHYTVIPASTGEPVDLTSDSGRAVQEDGSASSGYNFGCDPSTTITDFYATGTDTYGNTVTSNKVDPCPA